MKNCIQEKKYTPFVDIFDDQKYKKLKIFNHQQELIEDFSQNEKWWQENKVVASFTNDLVDNFNRTMRYKFWLDKDKTVPSDAIIKGDILVFNDGYKRIFRNSETIEVTESKKYYNNQMKLSYFIAKDKFGRTFKAIEPNDINIYREYLKELASQANKLQKLGQDESKRKALWRKYFAIKDDYADLKYSFASTIHKLQGSTYNEVYIDLTSIIGLAIKAEKKDIAYRLAYVAVTRASKDIKVLL